MIVFHLFFSTKGRVTRQTWWIATLALAAVEIAVSYVIQPDYWVLFDDINVDANMSMTLWTLAMVIPNYIVSMKRLHDIERSWWLAMSAAILAALGALADYLGYFGDAWFEILWPVLAVGLIFILYVIALCGFVRGTVGPNPYGPDPLPTKFGMSST